MHRFAGRAALITGGSSGIGLATAARLLREGARIIVNGRDAARLRVALERLSGLGEVSGIVADVSDEREVARLVGEALARLGRIDVLVHSAGIDGAGVDVLDLAPDTWRRVLKVNLTGPFLMAQAAARHMAEAGGGAIVNVASLNGLAAEPRFADYNSAKGGLVLLTRSLAVDLVDRHIRVNAVCPGYIRTPMTEPYLGDPETATAIVSAIPMHRAGMPEEVAAAIAFLASDDASYITGEVLVVDGGRLARQ
jgi:NAD(P)-dependent dehydrogenase (short-subunit alcohol dehydrogenase family)